jgi:hypothetical protein
LSNHKESTDLTIHVLSAALLLALAAALLLAVGVNLIGDRNPAPAPTHQRRRHPQGRVACPTKEPSPVTVQQRAGHRRQALLAGIQVWLTAINPAPGY